MILGISRARDEKGLLIVDGFRVVETGYAGRVYTKMRLMLGSGPLPCHASRRARVF